MIKDLKPVEVLALSKAVNGELKLARKKIPVGMYPVNFTVKIAGMVKVGKKFDQVRSTCDPWKILAVIAGQDQYIVNNAAEIAACIKDDDDIDVEIDDVKSYCQNLFDLNKIRCNGRVDAHLFSERSEFSCSGRIEDVLCKEGI